MAKKKTTRQAPPPAEPARPAVTAERFARLVRLVRALTKKGQTREQLTKQLALDVRGFYRDLELLRAVGIAVVLEGGEYSLREPEEEVLSRLPFPDPHLSLGEARQLARGKSRNHLALQEKIQQLLA
jgi:predicted DNA-binding transcriptional regulator YafY